MQRRSFWLMRGVLLSLVLLPLACSDDGATSPDGGGDLAIIADGAALDGVGADGGAADRGLRPDLFLPPASDLSKLTLYVSMGDSIAAGYGIGRGLSYAELLRQNVDTEYPAFEGKDFESVIGAGKVRLSLAAKSGATSADLVDQLQKAEQNATGDTLVTISAGGNDFLNNYQALLTDQGAEQIAATIFANLLKVKEHFADSAKYGGKVILIVFNVYDPTDNTGTLPADAEVTQICSILKTLGPQLGPQVLARLSKYNADLKAFADQHGFLVADIHTAFLGHGFNYQDKSSPYYDAHEPALWFLKDCIHPSYAGHNGLRRLLWGMLHGG